MDNTDKIEAISTALEKYRSRIGADPNMAKTDLYVCCHGLAPNNGKVPTDFDADSAEEYANYLIRVFQGQNGFNTGNRGQGGVSIANRASRISPAFVQTKAPDEKKSRVQAGSLFSAIVTVVRNRTGLKYTAAFNLVLADNRDLLAGALDGTKHTGPLLRLLNRTQSATGLSGPHSTELATDKVAKLTNRFFPVLVSAPTALQWDVLSRAAAQLEKCGIPSKIYNRASNADVSPKDLKTANDCEAAVLSFLEKQEDDSDLGNHGSFQNLSSGGKFAVFQRYIKRLMSEKGISLQEAFNELKETQPIFWVHSILSFQPDK